MNRAKETIVVDTNPLISTLRGGKSKIALFSDEFNFITTEHTTWEVKKYIPVISTQTDVPESELFYAFDRFPITAFPANVYDGNRKQAEAMIAHRDPKDVDIPALALRFDKPIWSNDNDFNIVSEVEILTSTDLLKKLTEMK